MTEVSLLFNIINMVQRQWHNHQEMCINPLKMPFNTIKYACYFTDFAICIFPRNSAMKKRTRHLIFAYFPYRSKMWITVLANLKYSCLHYYYLSVVKLHIFIFNYDCHRFNFFFQLHGHALKLDFQQCLDITDEKKKHNFN